MTGGLRAIAAATHVAPATTPAPARVEEDSRARWIGGASPHARQLAGDERVGRALDDWDHQRRKRIANGHERLHKRSVARIVRDAAHSGGPAEDAIDLLDGGLRLALRRMHAALGERAEHAPDAAGFMQRGTRASGLFERAALQRRTPRVIDQPCAHEPRQIAIEGDERIRLGMTRRLVGVDEVEPQSAGGERRSCAGHRVPKLSGVPLANIHLVTVGSTNPVKLAAVRAVIARLAPQAIVDGVAVASGVPDQPVSDAQTIEGAATRARRARAARDADLGVGIEGGVVETDGGMRTCAWAVVVGRDGMPHVGGSLSMPLPDAVAALIRDGVELGHAIDRLVGTTNIKHGAGAVGILTEGLVSRQQAYETILSYALAPLLLPALYRGTRNEGGGLGTGDEFGNE